MERKIITGLIFVACLFSSGVALSVVPTQGMINAARVRCHKLHPNPRGSERDKVFLPQCLKTVDDYVARKKDEKRIADLTAERDAAKAKAEQVAKEAEAVKLAAEAKAKVVAPVPTQREEVQASEAGQRRMLPRIPRGAPYRVVRAPGQYAAATSPAGMNYYLKIKALKLGARNWFREDVNFRVVIIKNGLPLAVAYPNGHFNEFYADLDGNGKVDSDPYKGVDPTLTDVVYVSYLPGDSVRIVFLRETVDFVDVPGFAPQQIWGYSVNVKPILPNKPGKWRVLAFNGSSH